MQPLSTLSGSALFATVLRFYFGIWLLYAGIIKWAGGAPQFVGFIVTEFKDTWAARIPFLLPLLGWVIILAEPILAILLLTGFRPRAAWLLTSLLMFLLLFGQTILMKAGVADNWLFVILTLTAAALTRDNAPGRTK